MPPLSAFAEMAPLLADGYIQNEGGYFVVDYYWTAYLKNDGTGAARGVMEFDVSAIGSTPLKSAILTIWQLDCFNIRNATLYAYAGDGAITVGDFDRTAVSIAGITFPAGYNFGVGVPFDTDVVTALQLAMDNNWARLGFRLETGYFSAGDIHYAAKGTSAWPYLGGQPPILSYELVPEPATLGLLLLGGAAVLRHRRRS